MSFLIPKAYSYKIVYSGKVPCSQVSGEAQTQAPWSPISSNAFPLVPHLCTPHPTFLGGVGLDFPKFQSMGTVRGLLVPDLKAQAPLRYFWASPD